MKKTRLDVLTYPELLAISEREYGYVKYWEDKDGNEHQYRSTVYVDSEDSLCRQFSELCSEHVEGGILYRCVLCHSKALNVYCAAINQTGRRCKNIVNPEWRDATNKTAWPPTHGEKYCNRHEREYVRAGRRFSIDMLDEWLDAWQKETILRWKKELLKKLEVLGRLTVLELFALSKSVPDNYVYFIKCGNYVKIGKSNSPERRFKSIVSEKDGTLRPANIDMSEAVLLGYVPGGDRLEGVLHGVLNSERDTGEWFRLSSKTCAVIENYMGSSEFTVSNTINSLITDYDVIIEKDLTDRLDVDSLYDAERKLSLHRWENGDEEL